MLDETLSFAVMLFVCLAVAIWFGRRHGRQHALGAGVATSLLAGTWFDVLVAGVEFNVTVATAAILLVHHCTFAWRDLFKSLGWLDVLVTAMFLWHVIDDTLHDGQPFRFLATAYGQWLLPYAAGRYAMVQPGALAKLTPVFATVTGVLSTLAIIEATMGVNLVEVTFCPLSEGIVRITQSRYGLAQRAFGTTENPIFLAVTLLALWPFAINLTARMRGSSAAWGWPALAVALPVFGVASTLSRGPVLCVGIATALLLSYAHHWFRWALLVVTLVGVPATYLKWDVVQDYVQTGGGEKSYSRIVFVEGKEAPEVHNNTSHRLLIAQIYFPIVWEGGPMGWGTVDSSGFPPRNLPGLPKDPTSRLRLKNVDNGYVNIGLAFGWVGLALFVTLLIGAIVAAIGLAPQMQTYFPPADWRFPVAVAAVIFALLLELATVHWNYDFAFWVLYVIGSLAGLICARKRLTREYDYGR